ncbi:MAG: NCS2 family permease [Pseudomonadota bacterium]
MLVLGVVCFLAIGILETLKVPGGILIGMIGATIVAALFGLTDLNWVGSPPPSLAPTFLALDIAAAAELALATVIISFLFVDMFDTAGTLVGVASKANLLDEDGKLPRLNRALIADSSATLIGSLIGTSSVTSYVESAAGVRAGGRTGLTAVVVASLFLLALFFAPLAQSVGPYATGAALVFVGCVMASGLAATDWDDVTSFVPVVVTAISMPLTYSIATGLGFGFVTFAVLKIGSGRIKELSGGVMVLAAVFLAKFIFIDAA